MLFPPTTVTVWSLVDDSAESSVSTETLMSGEPSMPLIPVRLTVTVIVELSASLTLEGDAEMEATGSVASSSLTSISTTDGVPTVYPVPG